MSNGKKKQILKFDKEGLITLHFFTEHLVFNVVIATYSDWEEQQVVYLYNHYKNQKMSTEDLCVWCINHKIQYQIMYPMGKYEVAKSPLRYIEYRRLLRRMQKVKG